MDSYTEEFKEPTNSFMTYNFYPKEGTMLIFPSKTSHTAMPYKLDDVRYSLAFNFMPVGMQGEADSSFRF